MSDEPQPREKQLRDRCRVDELLVTKIKTISEGRELVERINKDMARLLNEMRDYPQMTNELFKVYTDIRYDLKTARNNIQSQMTRFVKLKHK